jgi:cytochrome c peroxidase
MIFESAGTGCTTCHAGARTTDSQFDAPGVPRLHDVGTLGPGSGQRLGAPLIGIDTPTLLGLWSSAPYLHDGSAPALLEVLTVRNAGDRHGTTSQLSAAELDDLIAFLQSL